MFFTKRKVRGVSVDHPLGKDERIPAKLEEQRLRILTQRLRSGQETAEERQEIAKGHIRLAIQIAGRYVSVAPTKSDDLVSCGLFGIAYAINKAQEKLVDDEITPWIVACIHRFCHRFLTTDQIVRVPPTTYADWKKRGMPLPEKISTHLLDENKIPGCNSGHLYDIKEMLELSAKDEEDRTIIRMRSEGYRDREIAERLKMSVSYICAKRSKIEQRFDVYFNRCL